MFDVSGAGLQLTIVDSMHRAVCMLVNLHLNPLLSGEEEEVLAEKVPPKSGSMEAPQSMAVGTLLERIKVLVRRD